MGIPPRECESCCQAKSPQKWGVESSHKSEKYSILRARFCALVFLQRVRITRKLRRLGLAQFCQPVSRRAQLRVFRVGIHAPLVGGFCIFAAAVFDEE